MVEFTKTESYNIMPGDSIAVMSGITDTGHYTVTYGQVKSASYQGLTLEQPITVDDHTIACRIMSFKHKDPAHLLEVSFIENPLITLYHCKEV